MALRNQLKYSLNSLRHKDATLLSVCLAVPYRLTGGVQVIV
jgi:hypothetical protein